MKKTLLIILSFFYLGVASGATVHFHYCMGELVRLGLSKPEKSHCGSCGMSIEEGSKKSCCKNDYKKAKIDQSQKTSSFHFDFKQSPALLVNTMVLEVSETPLLFKFDKANLSNGPPDGQAVSIFIRNCSYRI